MKHWVLFPLLVLPCLTAQGDLYRWVDSSGEIHYSDQPPPANVKQVEKIKAAGGKPSDPPLPYALRQAVSNFPVTLYTTACGDACTRASELLAKRGIPYTEMDATDPSTQEELRKLTGGALEVPLLKVGRNVLRGFEEGGWNSSLDAAGYPVSAVIPPRPPIKPAKPAVAAPDAAPASAPPSGAASQ
jgi:glutaredoxin